MLIVWFLISIFSRTFIHYISRYKNLIPSILDRKVSKDEKKGNFAAGSWVITMFPFLRGEREGVRIELVKRSRLVCITITRYHSSLHSWNPQIWSTRYLKSYVSPEKCYYKIKVSRNFSLPNLSILQSIINIGCTNPCISIQFDSSTSQIDIPSRHLSNRHRYRGWHIRT